MLGEGSTVGVFLDDTVKEVGASRKKGPFAGTTPDTASPYYRRKETVRFRGGSVLKQCQKAKWRSAKAFAVS
jgi:hypothetical protein